MTNSFAEGILTRFSTFSNLEEDASANSRQSAYAGIESALGNLLGGGFADLRLDSSIFSLLGELGWIGGIPYLFGLVGLIFTCWKTSQWFTDSSSRLFFATAVTCLVRVPVNNSLVGVSGMILWGCLAFFLAGAKYTYHQQPTDESN
jgi:cell division protein FtsW (lipid II flippase)